jgi:hypothetical protein
MVENVHPGGLERARWSGCIAGARDGLLTPHFGHQARGSQSSRINSTPSCFSCISKVSSDMMQQWAVDQSVPGPRMPPAPEAGRRPYGDDGPAEPPCSHSKCLKFTGTRRKARACKTWRPAGGPGARLAIIREICAIEKKSLLSYVVYLNCLTFSIPMQPLETNTSFEHS